MLDRTRKTNSPPGAPAWMVTWGDMMSLLLAFFILLFSFSSINMNHFHRAMGSLRGSLGVGEYRQEAPPERAPVPDTFRRQQSDAARKMQRRLLVRGLDKQVKIACDTEGGIKISLPVSVLFDEGSASLTASAGPVLREFGEVLATLPEAFIEVKGHTGGESLQAGSGFDDNYDLSYARAHAVMRRLSMDGGVPERQFEVTACADHQPVALDSTDEGRARNRRVEIYVRGLVSGRMVDSLTEGALSKDTVAAPLESPAASAQPDVSRN